MTDAQKQAIKKELDDIRTEQARIDAEQRKIILRRRRYFRLLHNQHGMSFAEIAAGYGSKRQYIHQEVKAAS